MLDVDSPEQTGRLICNEASLIVCFSSQFSFKIRREWSEGFLKRLRSHLERCNASIGCTCGECGAPRVVAFVGKSQYISVHNATCERTERIQTVEIGKQNAKISVR